MDKLNAASSNIKYIWIYYDDNTRGTIEVNKTSTATEVTEIIIKNKRLESSDNILVKILEKENGEFKVFQFSQEESVYETFDNFFNSVFEPGYKSGKIYWRDPTVPFEFKTHLTKEKKILVIPSSDKDLSIEKPIRTGTVSKKSKKTVDFKERELILYVKNELPQNNFLIYKKINDHKYKKLILNNAEENQCQLDTYSNSVKTPYTFRFKSVEDYQKWVILLQAAIKESTKNEFLIAAQYDIERKELEQSNQDEKQLLSVSAGLKGLLKHKSSLEYLTRKLRAVHCEENIYFWLAVEEYKNIWRTSGISNMKKWEKAEEVFNNFLKRGDCPYEILVLPEQSEPVEKLIREQHDNFSASSSPPLDLYDELQEKIFSDIETVKEIKLNKGHYKRFVDCDDYSKIVTLSSLGIPAMKPREIASSNLKKQKKFGFF